MDTLYVYQMTYGENENGDFGLIFPSESYKNTQPTISFTIPIVEDFFLKTNFNLNVDFLFFLDTELYKIRAQINYPELIFKLPKLDNKIYFEFDYNHPFPFYSKFVYDKYIGNHVNLIPKNNGFLTIIPIDLFEMDELYKNFKGAFVGITPAIYELYNSEIELGI